MASFQAKIGWKMPGKREYIKYHSVSFLPDGLEKIPKKQQKNLKKYHYGFFSSQNRMEMAEKERKQKGIKPFFVPTFSHDSYFGP